MGTQNTAVDQRGAETTVRKRMLTADCRRSFPLLSGLARQPLRGGRG